MTTSPPDSFRLTARLITETASAPSPRVAGSEAISAARDRRSDRAAIAPGRAQRPTHESNESNAREAGAHAGDVAALARFYMPELPPELQIYQSRNYPPRETTLLVRLPDAFTFRYPPGAVERRLEGSVLLWVAVDEAGHILEMRDVDGDPALLQAARTQLSGVRMLPAEIDGTPVKQATLLQIEFRLQPAR